MEARKGGDKTLTRRLQITYFLSHKGKNEQPHLITLHHLNNSGFHLRDFKRGLSEFRGREMPESFSWSCKRAYKSSYIWQDLTEDDLIIPISDCEYVLMGSLLFSPIKIIEKLKEVKEKEKLLTTSTTLKTPIETFQIDNIISQKSLAEVDKESPIETSASTSSSSFEKDEEKNTVFKIDSWREVVKRIKKQSHEEIIPMVNEQQFNGASSSFEKAKKKTVTFKIDSSREETKIINRERNEEIVPKENGRQFNGVKIKKSNDDGASKWATVVKNFLKCRMVENDSIMNTMSNESSRNSISNNINKAKSENRMNQKRKEGRRKSLFFCGHALTCR